MNITLQVPSELEGQLQQAARTQGTDVATFLLDSARQRLRPDVLTEADAELLQIINAPLASQARQERDALLAKQARRTLTKTEQGALTSLIDTVEMANAQKWQALAALASRRGLSLPEIARRQVTCHLCGPDNC